MATIRLEDMRFFAYHGVYEEERLMGNQFIIHLSMEVGTKLAAMTDDIANTVNYETVYLICDQEMRKPVNLIETLAANIIRRIGEQFKVVQKVTITLEKLNPIPAGRLGLSSIEMTSNFTVSCPRCGNKYVPRTKKAEDYYAYHNIPPKVQSVLIQQYGGPICENCIGDFKR